MATEYSCASCDPGKYTSENLDKAQLTNFEEGEALVNEFSCPEGSVSDDSKCTDGMSNCCATGYNGDYASCKDGEIKLDVVKASAWNVLV